MDFGILGPLEVSDGDAVLAVPGPRQRALLALLVVHVGEVVSIDRLVETIWADDPPANPKNALHSQISQLRRNLHDQDQDLVASRPPGYVLRAEPDHVDAVRFERLARDGRQALHDGDVDRALSRLTGALALWRGAPLAEFAGQEFAEVAAARLQELRLGAIEDRIDADLRAGRHRDLVADLEQLIVGHPLRERLRGQLMLALARSGRQADALQVFHDTRRVLDEELGIDPGRDLVSLHEALLRQDDDPPLTTTEAHRPAVATVLPSALPRALSSFVGRADDLDRVVDLLHRSRLVTLTGPGGVGKTRLAIETASRTLDRGPATDGAWLVELAGLQDPTLVAEAVADTIGLATEAGLAAGAPEPRDTAARLRAALQRRRALLVLDNCEHLVDAVATFVRDLLGATAELTVLTTSREALGITGESVWSVPSLTLPPPGTEAEADGLDGWGATALFLDRVREADPRITVDDAGARIMMEVCRRLDGVPLALELAAARVRTLGLDELAARLDDRFTVLTGGDRTAQPRQKTLEAVIGWSWDLLDEAERTLFRRLAVFAGGATMEAIEAICADPNHLPRERVVEIVASLVDKSMLVADRNTRPTRYRMLESLHAYATKRLADSLEDGETRDRHADHLLTLVVDTVPQLRGRHQLAAMDHLDLLLDDLRSALRWLEESVDGRRGGRLATELGWYWYLRGHRTEGLRWLTAFADAAPREAALATLWAALLAPTADPALDLPARMEHAADVLADHGTLADHTFAELLIAAVMTAFGDHERAGRHLDHARALIDQTGDDGHAAIADLLTGNFFLVSGDVDRARSWLEAALGRFADVGDRWGQVQCLGSLLSTAEAAGDLAGAQRHADRGIELAVELRLAELEAILHSRRATVATLAGDHDGANASLRQARQLADELGDAMVGGTVDLAAGFVALRVGNLVDAEQYFERVVTWVGDAPLPAVRAYALTRLGTVAELSGDLDRAAQLQRDSYHQACQTGDPRSVALALEGLAAAHAAVGRGEDAAVLLGAAQARRDAVGLPLSKVERTDVDRAEDNARAAVGDDLFAAALERGRALPDDELPIA